MARKETKIPMNLLTVEQLAHEHQELERRLENLNRRGYLTPSEQIERKTIQKLKLLKKDQIAILTRQAHA
jgi:uncharacterized protein